MCSRLGEDVLLENEKFFELKSGKYRDGIKRKETRWGFGTVARWGRADVHRSHFKIAHFEIADFKFAHSNLYTSKKVSSKFHHFKIAEVRGFPKIIIWVVARARPLMCLRTRRGLAHMQLSHGV